MRVDEVLAALPKLSQPELASVRAALEHLLVHQVDELDTTSPLYIAMSELLGVGLSFRDFHNAQSYSTWRKVAPKVVAFMEATFPHTTKVTKFAMMTFMLEALMDDLKGRGVPLTLSTVTVNLARLPALFDQEFPGYRESGKAHLVLKAMTKGHKGE